MIPVGARYIGNERQQNDNLIAVSNALRLGDCFLELAAKFVSEAVAEIEAGKRSLFGIDSPAYLAQVRGEGRAIFVLQRAIEAGDLSLWRIHGGREVQIVPLSLSHNDVQYGIFNTYNRPEPEMQGAWLWVKVLDWAAFFAAVPSRCEPELSDQNPQGGRPRKLESVIAGLKQLYPVDAQRKRIPPKVAVRDLSALGIDASESTVKRAKNMS